MTIAGKNDKEEEENQPEKSNGPSEDELRKAHEILLRAGKAEMAKQLQKQIPVKPKEEDTGTVPLAHRKKFNQAAQYADACKKKVQQLDTE
eukprot:2197089-Alexandrium_andersonii.AAC.1